MTFALKSSVAVSILAVLSTGALAADLRGSAKDGPSNYAPESRGINFSGFYIGGAIGYGNANHDLSVRDYFKDYCADVGEEFDPFENSDRDDTLASINGDKLTTNPRFRTACNTQTGRAASESVTAISTTPGWNTTGVAGDSREVASLDGLNSTGIVGDVRLGYDQQMGRFVVGVFGSYGLSGMEAEGTNTLFGEHFTLERGDDWSVGVRAGLLVNERTLLYILAAYTQTEYDLRITEGDESRSKTTTFDGVTVGGGVEFAVASNVFLGIEGSHTFYGEETIFDAYDGKANVGTKIVDDLDETRVLGTLKVKLNNGLFGN